MSLLKLGQVSHKLEYLPQLPNGIWQRKEKGEQKVICSPKQQITLGHVYFVDFSSCNLNQVAVYHSPILSQFSAAYSHK